MMTLMRQPAPEDLDGPGCGVVAHPDSCLCDVVIEKPCVVNYHPSDVGHGEIIRNALGMKDLREAPASKVLDYMAVLAQLTEMASMYDEGHVEGHAEKRERLMAYLRGGGKVADVQADLGIELIEINRLIANNQPNSPYLTFTLDDWAFVESVIDDPDIPNYRIHQRFRNSDRSFGKTTYRTLRTGDPYPRRRT